MFHADLHIHSRFSRACSKDCDIEHLAWWALRKGITVVGTGDFTHPAWAAELRESLIPAEPGLLRLRPELEAELRRTSPASCQGEVRFLLSAEISTIYRGGERTRKVHHLIYAPTFESADRITQALAKIGNLASDGRPIIGLDSRDLLEITLAGGPGCYLVPAHVWTPWFAVLGSKSGFDLVADCYRDLASEVFAIETGLSSDPPMNWMCSSLDSYRLVSNSDAHSPPMLGREATTLSCDLDYFAIERALRTGDELAGTINFFPEGGRYHLDGHRKCGIRLEPAQTRVTGGSCPHCGRPLTIGVAHRVAELADRPAGYRPPGAPAFASLVQLRQVIGELSSVGPASKKVSAEVSRLVSVLGPELSILSDIPLPELARAGGELLAEAVARLRRGEVLREAGFDGEYGTIALFAPGELTAGATLFDLPAAVPAPRRPARPGGPGQPSGGELAADPGQAGTGQAGSGGQASWAEPTAGAELTPGAELTAAAELTAGAELAGLAGLDPEQRAAARAASPLMIVAGPGTGKTRTLTRRIAWQAAELRILPSQCLAVTFTRRAAQEMRERLALLDERLAGVTVTTFHGLGLRILREAHAAAGLPADFEVADEAAVAALAAELGLSATPARAPAATDAGTPATGTPGTGPPATETPGPGTPSTGTPAVAPTPGTGTAGTGTAGTGTAGTGTAGTGTAGTGTAGTGTAGTGTAGTGTAGTGTAGTGTAGTGTAGTGTAGTGTAGTGTAGTGTAGTGTAGTGTAGTGTAGTGTAGTGTAGTGTAGTGTAGTGTAGTGTAGTGTAGTGTAGTGTAGTGTAGTGTGAPCTETAAAGRTAGSRTEAAGGARAALVAALAERGLVDFDGLIELPTAVLRADPGLAARFRERWRLISVDEYQDIDSGQYELLALLAGDGSGLTVIGDPDQAIYGFRGADVRFFLRFATDYPGAVTATLTRNYRSAQPVVAAAVAAITPGTLVPGRTLRAVRAGRGRAAPVISHGTADEHAEAAWISATIDQLLGGTSFHSLDSGRATPEGHAGLSLAGIAVLYRTDAQSAALGQALTRSGLPYRKGSHDLLRRRPGVPEVLAQLRGQPAGPGPVPEMPATEIPATGVPATGIPATGVPATGVPATGVPATGVPATGVPATGVPVADALAAAVRGRAAGLPRSRAVDILAAGELLAPLARRCGTDFEQFWAEVSLGALVDALDPRADAVTLLTMHAAKGLEFEVVFVAGCEDGLLPLRTPGGGLLPGTDPAEERRLLFVAMTRARARLFLSYAASRTRAASERPAGASPFLRILGSDVITSTAAVPRPRQPQQLRLL